MSVNRVILVGRLGQNAEGKFTQNSNFILNASLATSEQFKDKEGKKTINTSWHRLVAFGKRWENIAQYLLKGTQIYVEGKIQYREYNNKDGIKVYATDIIVEEIKLLGDGSKSTTPAKEQLPLDKAMHKVQASSDNPFADLEGDPLPF